MMKAFQSNSYLFGGNAPYIEELYESYLDNPGSVPDAWRALVRQHAGGACRRRQLADARHRARSDRAIVRAAREGRHAAAAPDGRRRRRSAQAGVRAVAGRGLPQPRFALGRSRSAQAPGAPGDPRAGAGVLRLHRGRPRQHLLGRQYLFRLRQCAAARHRQGAARHLLRIDRRRVHVHQRPDAEALDPGAPRVDTGAAGLLDRQEEAHPRPADRRPKGSSATCTPATSGRSVFRSRGREFHRRDGRAGGPGRRGRHPGNHHRHGAPRPPERAGEHARQDAQGTVRRVRGSSRRRPAGRRRQVSQGLLERRLDARRAGAPVAGVQPFAPRDRQSGGRGFLQGAHGAPRRPQRRLRAAGPGARRRGLRRAGCGDGDAQPGADARIRNARHGAHRHQQPDRIHHLRPARHALDDLLHRRGEDDRGASVPRERRRRRGGRPTRPNSRWNSGNCSARTWWSTSSASGGSVTTSRTRRR